MKIIYLLPILTLLPISNAFAVLYDDGVLITSDTSSIQNISISANTNTTINWTVETQTRENYRLEKIDFFIMDPRMVDWNIGLSSFSWNGIVIPMSQMDENLQGNYVEYSYDVAHSLFVSSVPFSNISPPMKIGLNIYTNMISGQEIPVQMQIEYINNDGIKNVDGSEFVLLDAIKENSPLTYGAGTNEVPTIKHDIVKQNNTMNDFMPWIIIFSITASMAISIFVINYTKIRKQQRNNMSFHSRFYCPTCQSKNLMVDSDEKYFKNKPYGYYCIDCKQHFKIERVGTI